MKREEISRSGWLSLAFFGPICLQLKLGPVSQFAPGTPGPVKAPCRRLISSISTSIPDYSLPDGCCRIDRLMDRAAALGMPALALTDHGNLYGAIEFYSAAKAWASSRLLRNLPGRGLAPGKERPRRGRQELLLHGFARAQPDRLPELLKLRERRASARLLLLPRADFETLCQARRRSPASPRLLRCRPSICCTTAGRTPARPPPASWIFAGNTSWSKSAVPRHPRAAQDQPCLRSSSHRSSASRSFARTTSTTSGPRTPARTTPCRTDRLKNRR